MVGHIVGWRRDVENERQAFKKKSRVIIGRKLVSIRVHMNEDSFFSKSEVQKGL